MKLEVGMYVRNDRGIAKYLGKGIEVVPHQENYKDDFIFDNQIFNVGYGWGDTLYLSDFYNIEKYIIGKPSYNIIDLIERKDIILGTDGNIYQCSFVKDNYVYTTSYNELGETKTLTDYQIKSTVTHEQFEANAYTIEKER